MVPSSEKSSCHVVYQSMYLRLFNAVTDALEALDAERPEEAKRLLVQAQQACEELYLRA